MRNLQSCAQQLTDTSENEDTSASSPVTSPPPFSNNSNEVTSLTPRELVKHLDRNIVGQVGAPDIFFAGETSTGRKLLQRSLKAMGCDRIVGMQVISIIECVYSEISLLLL